MVGGRITVHKLADLLKLSDGKSGTADITYAFHADATGYIPLLSNQQGLTIYPTGVESSNGTETTEQLQQLLPSNNLDRNCQKAFDSYKKYPGRLGTEYGKYTCLPPTNSPRFKWMKVKVKAKRIGNTIFIQSGINSEWRVAYSTQGQAYSQRFAPSPTYQYLRWVATGESKLPDIQLILKPKEPEHTPTTETPVSNLPETSSTPSQASASQSNAPHKLAATGSTTLNAIILTAILFTAGAVLVIVRRTTQRLE